MTVERPVTRSFKPRRRGLSPLRAERYARLAPRWSLAPQGPLLDWREVFGVAGPVVLDIGFGGGEGLIELAAARPDERVVGVDVHTPGVGNVLDAIDVSGWQHVRVVEGDALEFVHRVPPGSLAGVRLYFPDPWPKMAQRHRRIVRPDVIALLVDRLAEGGSLHLATDNAEYAEFAQRLIAAEPRLRGGVVPRPAWRPTTRYERKAIVAGRAAIDLIYTRTQRWHDVPSNHDRPEEH